MSAAATALLDALPLRLGVAPRWVERHPDAVAFVAGETGCWLFAQQDLLHVEVRVAVLARDRQAALRFCDDRNHRALVGRWVLDEEAGVVALVADLPAPDDAAWDVEPVAVEAAAEMINAVATVQYYSSTLAAAVGPKALAAIRGEFWDSPNAVHEHLPTHTYALGATGDVAEQALVLAQDIMLIPLLDWHVDNDSDALRAHKDGTRLLLQVTRHPIAGWGLVVSVSPPWTTDLDELGELNLSADPRKHLLGHWTSNGDIVEHRMFLSNALLEACGPGWAPANLICELVTALARQPDEAGVASAVLRPHWPGDDLAQVRVRREPWNDHRPDDDPEWYAVFLDMLGRMGTMTEPSYRVWQAQLTEEDRDDPRVTRFCSFMDARMADRNERVALYGTHLPSDEQVTGLTSGEPGAVDQASAGWHAEHGPEAAPDGDPTTGADALGVLHDDQER